MKLDISKIVDVEIEGIDHKDYPDYVDAYVSKASYPTRENPHPLIKEDWRYLTEDELEYLNDKHRDWVYEKVMNFIH